MQIGSLRPEEYISRGGGITVVETFGPPETMKSTKILLAGRFFGCNSQQTNIFKINDASKSKMIDYRSLLPNSCIKFVIVPIYIYFV